MHHTYDGLGRLIRAQRPWPQPAANETRVRTEHFYYDGVRRIQEVFTDPVPDADTDNDGVEIKDDPGSGGDDPTPPPPQVITWTDREYIWGPDNVDELVAQITPSSSTGGPSTYSSDYALYALTQTNGTISGLIDSAGVVKAQYTFDPYGEVLAAEVASGMPRNRIGHQGLFFDRLDAATAAEQLGRGYAGVYYNRNRTYLPGLGRFLQRDPNGTAQRCPEFATSLGGAASSPNATFNPRQLYSGGTNLFGYVQQNAVNRTDPMGLFDVGLLGVMMGSTTLEELQTDWSQDIADVGLSLRDSMGAFFDAAALDQTTDASWALDWSQPDDFYTKSAAYSDATGSWAEYWGCGDGSAPTPTGNEIAMASGAGFGKGLGGRVLGGGVYVLYNAAGEIEYVGRTVDFARREREHASKGLKFKAVFSNVTYDEMRGLEQYMWKEAKMRDKAVRNLIRPIAKKNKNARNYMQAARKFLRGR
jgi:uncharacterized protein RhaS with RHS repeats/predicted GIY-YIG superfamily endonuclease